MRPPAVAGIAAACSMAAAIAVAAPAAADIETRGACSASSAWEADVEREYGVYAIDIEVKTTSAGERWRLTVDQNGTRVFAGTRTATSDYDDRYADADWEVIRRDRPGIADRFTVIATNLVSGETCRTTLRG